MKPGGSKPHSKGLSNNSCELNQPKRDEVLVRYLARKQFSASLWVDPNPEP